MVSTSVISPTRSKSIAATFYQVAGAAGGGRGAVIDGSDSTVYLAEGDCGKNRRACFVDVTTAGQQRFLWIMVDLRRAQSDWDLIGSIGHELRHAVEVIDSPYSYPRISDVRAARTVGVTVFALPAVVGCS